MSEWVLVIGMMLVTFLPRYLPLALAGRVSLPEWVENALRFVPIAVLSAIVVQISVIQEGAVYLAMDNAYLWAALAAGILACLRRGLLSIVCGGILVFVIVRHWPFSSPIG